MTKSSGPAWFIIAAILLVGLAIIGVFPKPPVLHILVIWVISIGLIGGMIASIGYSKTGRASGIAIDARNRYSLSQAQMVFWTILVLATVYTIIIWNTGHPPSKDQPFLKVPNFLWALMGISSISLVGSPLILNNKPAGELPAANGEPREARLSDLVFGEETGNQGTVDLARVQMLLISIIVGVSYSVLIAARLGEEAGKGAIKGFPDMDGGLLALIAISHAGYLTYKTVKK